TLLAEERVDNGRAIVAVKAQEALYLVTVLGDRVFHIPPSSGRFFVIVDRFDQLDVVALDPLDEAVAALARIRGTDVPYEGHELAAVGEELHRCLTGRFAGVEVVRADVDQSP